MIAEKKHHKSKRPKNGINVFFAGYSIANNEKAKIQISFSNEQQKKWRLSNLCDEQKRHQIWCTSKIVTATIWQQPRINIVCKVKSKMCDFIRVFFALFLLQLPTMNIHNLAQLKQKFYEQFGFMQMFRLENWNSMYLYIYNSGIKWNKRALHEWALHSQRPFKESTIKWKMLSFILIKYEMFTANTLRTFSFVHY